MALSTHRRDEPLRRPRPYIKSSPVGEPRGGTRLDNSKTERSCGAAALTWVAVGDRASRLGCRSDAPPVHKRCMVHVSAVQGYRHTCMLHAGPKRSSLPRTLSLGEGVVSASRHCGRMNLSCSQLVAAAIFACRWAFEQAPGTCRRPTCMRGIRNATRLRCAFVTLGSKHAHARCCGMQC